MAINKTIREGVKLSTSGAVQIMIGGIVAAVIPPQVSVIYKIAAYIGGLMVTWYAGEKMDEFVDKKLDETEEVIDEVKAVAAEAKKNIENKEKELGA